MGFIIILFVWYMLSVRNNPAKFKKVKSNKWKWGVLLAILLMSSGSSGILGLSAIAATFGIPAFIIYKIIKASSSTQKEVKQERNTAVPKSEQLPNAVPKRIKIIEKFNNKYGLNLTDAQIQTMVDASYISTDWENFIISMTKEYTTVHQWFRAPIGAWLRVYLKVFNVQTISSDMQQQRNICLESFDQIFRTADLSTYNTPAWDINKINNTFMTNFDDISFMIAYRFLEANGRKHNLGKVTILKADEELSELKKKYDAQTGAPMPLQ